MGMTTDEIIQELKRTKDYLASDPASNEALDGAINIIHKYQKIEKIIRNYDVTWEFHFLRDTTDKIREVLEDGRT